MKLFSAAQQFVDAAYRHPRRALLAASVVAVLVSCYPIVFFGRSFASGNSVPMLYSSIPTLPGHSEMETEKFKGADVGALLWHDVPNTFVQNRALFSDGELPLWNRYNSCGLTLLGQGQSMFGDPLHMLVIAAGGEAWVWDLKFLLAKVLFCFGLGLAVYSSSRSLPTALLLSASSAFLGFFAYRFNHPAFFSVMYAPWILLCWIEVTRALDIRTASRWAIGLFLACWTQLNSGTVKEAYMLLLSLNATGLLIFLLSQTAFRVRKLIYLTLAGLVLLLIGAPVWLTFFDALQKAYVPYKEAALAYQIQPGLLLGFFDDIFYRAANEGWLVFDPSANFFILLGCLFSIVYLRRLVRDRMFLGLGISTLGSAALVFGVIPRGWIQKVPMINNIWHIDNTFSCVLLIQVIVLAGFGLAYFLRNARRSTRLDLWLLALSFFVILGAWLGFSQVVQRLPNEFNPSGQAVPNKFFYRYCFTIIGALIGFPLVVRMVARKPSLKPLGFSFAFVCLVLLHWRHGFHLTTGARQIDEVTVNPSPRTDFDVSSPALDFLKREPGLFRVAGVGSVLFPGYNAIPGIESIYGPDPLANPYYHELLTTAGVRQEWSWRWIVEASNPGPRPLYDLMNVRYFLDMPARRQAPPASYVDKPPLDLEIIRNDTAWPRAFFVGNVSSYDHVREFVEMLRHPHPSPFAAVQSADRAALGEVPAGDGAAVPARDYRLTSNTTIFTVEAPGPGIAVLTESFLEDDFQVTINGAPATYFRVNHAFRGVKIPSAGKYEISYSYWPRYFTISLLLAGAGLLILVGWVLVAGRRDRETLAARDPVSVV